MSEVMATLVLRERGKVVRAAREVEALARVLREAMEGEGSSHPEDVMGELMEECLGLGERLARWNAFQEAASRA